ncbi:hypothetical protein [Salipiger sp.]|uniref:hypothetical protein n=1 Tax=Salipiger sp. TaxID=2078585 RepID=UPI003A96A0ED
MTLRPCLFAAALAAFLAAPSGSRAVAPGASLDAAEELAICAGRLSALTDHLWQMNDPLAPAAELRRDWMVALYEASLPTAGDPGMSRSALLLGRIRAKRDLDRLLETGEFNPDRRRARMARSLADRQMDSCIALMTR